jgi:C-terminal processing protease CtpA/Prc
MKLLKMVLFASFVPAMAFAQPTPDQTPDQPTDPTQEAGGTASNRDTMNTGTAFGLTAKPLTADKRATYGGPKDAGLLVTKVDPGSAASEAGIKVGDVITKIDQNQLSTTDDLTKAEQGQKGEAKSVAIEVVRDHQTKDLQLKVGEKMEKPETQPSPDMPKGGY